MIEWKSEGARELLRDEEILAVKQQAKLAWETVLEANGPGAEYIGWFDLPANPDKEEFERILKAAERIRSSSELFVLAGIGGSYLGARAVIDALDNPFESSAEKRERAVPRILYAGNNLSSTYLEQLMKALQGHELSLNVVSKSGGTTETAVAFRILRAYMEKQYGEKAAERIYATTDAKRGALKSLSTQKGYESFVIPDNIGGRYSVLTAVGLLPIAVAGFDVKALLEGALEMRTHLIEEGEENIALRYAVARNLLYRRGYHVEVLASFEPGLATLHEWWKQLFGESEGKDGKGIFPASVSYSTDLHSLGQYLQDGKRMLFETFLTIKEANESLRIPEDVESEDGLAYLEGRPLSFLQEKAIMGTELAHADGGTPNFEISLERLDEKSLGALIFFFETACAVSAYLNGVNPFNQPGVEDYKKNMFALLGRPGYEDLKKELENRR